MKNVRMILLSLLTVVLGIYAFGAFYYYQHTFPNTTYNGNLYGDLTKDQLKAKLDANETTDIVLNEGSYKEVIPGKAVEFTHTYDVSNVQLNPSFLLWPIKLNENYDLGEIPYKEHYNEDLLKEKVKNSDLATKIKREPSEDAKVILGSKKYEVAEEKYGNTLDMDKLIASVVTSVNSSKPEVDVKAANPYLPPKVFKDNENLKKEAEYKNRWKDTDIVLDLAGKKIPLIDWTTDSGFKTKEEENFEEDNNENIVKVVEGLAEKYDTVNIERQFNSSHGTTVTLDPGSFGFEIDQDTLISLIGENLYQGNKTVIEVPFLNEGINIEKDEIGNTYVEIDLSTQQIFVYKEGKKIIDSLVVSGNVTIDGRATPTGAFYIWSKSRDTNLVSTVPGDEYSAFVHYWMPFTDEQHGLHDASWISDFGGTLYEQVGSHGCINLMSDVAAQIYEMAEYGMPVIIYKSGLPPSKTYYEQLEEEESKTSTSDEADSESYEEEEEEE